MKLNQDYKDILRIFNDCKVEYLIIGAYAVIFYATPRFTRDLDLCINPTISNAKKVYKALKHFGAPLKNVSLKDFSTEGLIFQIGIDPIRIDIIMGLPGIKFSSLWKNKTESKFDDIKVNIIDIKSLIKIKKSLKRNKDLCDIEDLTKILKKQS